jgi:hypothetical protein
MRRTWITMIVMLALVAGLGLWLWLRPAAVKPARERVSTSSPDSARELRIEWPGKAVIAMKKDGGAWRIVAPHTGRAEPLQVERILSLLEATSELALPANDLARFELDQPRARITVDGRDYALGGTNPLTGSMYLQRGDKVLLVEPRYAGVIPADPQSLNDRRMLAAHETPVAFSFPQFKVAQQVGKWQVTPADAELSQDDILRWVEGWRLAAALRAEPVEGRAPVSHIAVDLRDGRRIAIGVTEQSGEIAFTRYDEHMRYYFFANGARRLLAPPSTGAK